MSQLKDQLEYLSGFRNMFETEAKANTLPTMGRNSPQKVAHGLYAEQLSGSAFTAPRSHNLRTWMYRIRPSVAHSDYRKISHEHWLTGGAVAAELTMAVPTQLRWSPLPAAQGSVDFIAGMRTYVVNGSAPTRGGVSVHMYAANASMKNYFYSADGELLIVPQSGRLMVHTECGKLQVEPLEIVAIPRGMKFRIELLDKSAVGYVCENYGAPFQLPDLGPIGSNGLAQPRDFLTPVAAFEDTNAECLVQCKFQGQFFEYTLQGSPLNVVAWHGNYAPYKYDLRKYNTIGTVSFDHPDPSIFTVLTSPTNTPGTANCDLAIFPPRWMVGEDTFRPPYYHRNVMSEFMGLITGQYDAKPNGFSPGGASLHNCMSAHGPDAETFVKASAVDLKPEKQTDTMAFMFESCWNFDVSRWAVNSTHRQKDYLDCWKGL